MKCTVLKEIFEDRLSLSSRFVSYRVSSVQSIQGAKLDVSKDGLTLMTTNLGDTFFTKMEAEVEQGGSVVFDLKKALEFLNLLSNGPIELEIEDASVKISQGKTQGYFQTYAAQDFPDLPVLEGSTFPLESKLLEKLSYVTFCASRDETRPVMTGIFISENETGPLFVSTDGFRLSILQTELKHKIPQTILPASIFQEISRIAKRGDDVIMTLSPEDRLVKFSIGSIDIYSRIIEGEFPPYQKVVPSSSSTIFTVDASELLKNIKLVAIFARDEADVVIFDITKEGLSIRPKSTAKKNSKVFLAHEDFEGDSLKIAFNYKYVVDFLNTVSAEKIRIKCTHATAPCIFEAIDNDEFLHVIMPLRVEETAG